MWNRDLVKHPMNVIFDWCDLKLKSEKVCRALEAEKAKAAEMRIWIESMRLDIIEKDKEYVLL